MPYSANVYRVMIASPSDVAKERQIIREVIHEWNSVHSEDRGIVLMPLDGKAIHRPIWEPGRKK